MARCQSWQTNLTAGQSNVLSLAQQADAGTTSGAASAPASSATAGTAGTSTSGSVFSPSTWLAAIGNSLGALAGRAGLIVLAIILLLGAIYHSQGARRK